MLQLASATPKLSENSNSDYFSWPTELREWRDAYDSAEGTVDYLEARETQLHRDRMEGYLVSDEDLNEVRELVSAAYNLKKRIDAAGSKLLAKWDPENCAWKGEATPSAPADLPF